MRFNLRHVVHDERGMSLVFVCVGFMAMLSATTLAIDVGMFMTARSQAQNAADAGAHAGAVALVFNSFTDRSATGPAKMSAVNSALANTVMGQPVAVTPADVTFPTDPAGVANRVQVLVSRTVARSNPVATVMGSIFGLNTVDITASATAEASPAAAEMCVKPFTIPDKWREVDNGPWTPQSEFNPAKDVYIGLNPYPDPNTNYTGYNAERDRGLELVLKASNATKITASFYNPYDLPGSVGASDYRANIDGCNTSIIDIGDTRPPENGNMVGPTKQGTQALIDKDPGARWDTGCNCVQGSAYGSHSPRIIIIPVYDPVAYANGPQTGKNIVLKFTNFIGFFIEPLNGAGEVLGRITPVAGLMPGGAGPAPVGAFAQIIRLVQ